MYFASKAWRVGESKLSTCILFWTNARCCYRKRQVQYLHDTSLKICTHRWTRGAFPQSNQRNCVQRARKNSESGPKGPCSGLDFRLGRYAQGLAHLLSSVLPSVLTYRTPGVKIRQTSLWHGATNTAVGTSMIRATSLGTSVSVCPDIAPRCMTLVGRMAVVG